MPPHESRWAARGFEVFVYVTLAVWFVASVILFARFTSATYSLTLPLFLCYLAGIGVSLASGFAMWRQRRWRSLLPLGVCILALVAARISTQCARELLFTRALPSYEAEVRRIESGTISVPVGWNWLRGAEDDVRLCYLVAAERTAAGVLMVEFDFDRGCALYHSAYVYSSSGRIEPGSHMDQRWPSRGKMGSNWFAVVH